MSAESIGLLAFFGLLLMSSAFFSSAETAFFSLNPLHLRRLSRRHPQAGAAIHALLAQPTQLLAAILIGNTSVNVAAAAVGYLLAERFWPSYAELISVVAVTLLLIVFGEAAPKRAGLLFTEALAVGYARPLRLLVGLTTPLRRLLEALTRAFEPLFRPRGRTLSEEEFESVLEMSSEEGIINADELAMIKAIIKLEDLKASDVMTPRVDLLGLDLEADPAGYLGRVRAARRNYLLLHRGGFDQVEGFLDVRRFLLDPEHRLDAARLPPYYVPENTPLNRLIGQFQRERRRIAVVVDEYGGTAGVVTRGDMVEEITGEIYHELSRPRPLFQEAGPHRWLVDANFSLEELNRKLRLGLQAEGADRLAGWIAAHVGHVPQRDDVVEAQGCRVTVLQTQRQRVTLAQIEKGEAAP